MTSKLDPEQERKEINSELLRLWKEAEDIRLKLLAQANTVKSGADSPQKERMLLLGKLDTITDEIKVLRARFDKLPKQ